MNLIQQFLRANATQDWLFAAAALACSMMVFELARRVILRRLKRMSRPDSTAAQLFIAVVSATRILLSAAVGIYIAVHFLHLPPAAQKLTDRVFLVLLLLQSGLWAAQVLDFWLRQRFLAGQNAADGAHAMTHSLLSFLGRVVLWSLVTLLVLDNLGLNVTTLVASMGIGGVAVALAVQNILGDLFASLSIAVDQPFVIGDSIVVDGLAGKVEHVGLKTTRIRSLSGEQIIFANNDLLKSRIHNYKRMEERRALFTLGVTYDTPHAKLTQIPGLIRATIEAQPGVRFERAHFKTFGPSSLDFEAVYFVLSPEYSKFMDIQQTINLELVRVFAEKGIEFAFPTQTVHLAAPVPGAVFTPTSPADSNS